jgi:hypothetical protein
MLLGAAFFVSLLVPRQALARRSGESSSPGLLSV